MMIALQHIVFILLVALLSNISCQFLIMKYVPVVRIVPSIFIGFGAGLISMVFCLTLANYFRDIFADWWAYDMILFFSYCGFSNLYFDYINIGHTSIRVRILQKLYQSKDHGSAVADVQDLCNAEHLLETRLSRLQAGGHIQQNALGEFVLYDQSKMLMVALFFEFLKILILPNRAPRNFSRQ